MVEPLSEDELAILRVNRAEGELAEQRERVARFRAESGPSKAAENMLTNLENAHELLKGRLFDLSGEATAYLCFVMKQEDIAAARTLECADDAEVFVKAAELLETMSECQSIEIWHGKRLVGRIPKR